MSGTDLTQSSFNSPIFSFQNALDTYSGNMFFPDTPLDSYGSPIFLSAGCLVNGTRNCTAACTDAGLIFANPYTMQNCMVMASLVLVLSRATLLNEPLSPDLLTTATNFSIDLADPELPNRLSNINKTISDCMIQFSGNHSNSYVGLQMSCSPFCDTPLDNHDEDCGYYCYGNICPTRKSVSVNPDVDGIGVYISYWTQTGIAILLFILLKVCDAFVYRIFILLRGSFGPDWRFGPVIKELAYKAQTPLNRYQPAIISATVEFQKAQCFFMLAIGIASQIVLRQGSLEDGSLQSLINYTIIGTISINGFLPVTLTLLCLHTVGMHSWYILILSSCTILLSTATLFMSHNFTASGQSLGNIQAATNADYPLCGNKDPSRFCLDEAYGLVYGTRKVTSSLAVSGTNLGADGIVYGTSLANDVGRPAAILSLVILGLLILDYSEFQEVPVIQRFFKRFFSHNESKRPMSIDLSNPRRASKTDTAKDYIERTSNVLYLIIWTWYIVEISKFLRSLRSITPVSGWSFGQIIAITVWAGPILEFGKLVFQGLKAGLDYRTPFPYEIVDTQKSDEEPAAHVKDEIFSWAHPVRSSRGILKRKLQKHFVSDGSQPGEVLKIF